jgi:hypothetical protein
MAKNRAPAPLLETAIGCVSTAWARLEFTLAEIMAVLLEAPSDSTHVASAALDYRHRRDLILSLAEVKLEDDPIYPRLIDFMGEVGGMSKERNLSVHSVWLTPDGTHPYRLSLQNRGSFDVDLKRVSTRHLMTIANKIGRLATDGFDLTDPLSAAVATWREKFDAQAPRPKGPAAHRLGEVRAAYGFPPQSSEE